MAVQTITYGDKSYLNENADIPATNKVQDTDMNEIKTVVNNNATELTNITGQILWTNPNPASNFSAQTITLLNNDYDILEFYFIGNASAISTTIFSEKILKGYNVLVSHIINLNEGVSQATGVRQRQAIYSDDITYNITDALIRDGGSASEPTVENQKLIPLYIIGYKTGLFN